MAITVSEAFRENCYDLTKKQRLTLIGTNGSLLCNENINVAEGATFNIACIQSQQVMFGETPTNTMSISILNDGGFTELDFSNTEYSANFGVEVDDEEIKVSPLTICYMRANSEFISVRSTAPYIKGNITLGSVLPQLLSGADSKVMYLYGRLYFVVEQNGTRYYAKHTKVTDYVYSEYTACNARERALLDAFFDRSEVVGIAYTDGAVREFVKVSDMDDYMLWDKVKTFFWNGIKSATWSAYSSATGKTWGYLKDNTTWGSLYNEEKKWKDFCGYSVFMEIEYECVPYGVWKFDKPRRLNEAQLTLNGKDRMTRFDEDSIGFMEWERSAGVTNITIRTLIERIAIYKNMTVGDLSGLNELATEITINPSVYYQYKSLKDLLSYAFEVCGSNACIDRQGRLASMSMDDTPIELPYVYTFDIADYTAHTLRSVLIYRHGETALYQTDTSLEEGEVYDWYDNPFFTKPAPTGSYFSNGNNTKLGAFRNAITVTEADYSMWCDDVYEWDEEREPIFCMEVKWNGSGRVTYTNYGEETRQYSNYNNRSNAVSAVTENNVKGLKDAQDADKLAFDVTGLTVESNGLRIKNSNGDVVFDADSSGNLVLEGTIYADAGRIGNWDILDDNLKCTNANDPNNFILLGKERGTPTFQLGESGIVTSSGEVNYNTKIGASSFSFSENSTIRAYLSYGISSRGRTFTLHANAVNDSYGDVDIRIEASKIMFIGETPQFSHAPQIVGTNLPTTTSSANTNLTSLTGGNYQIKRVSSLRKFKDNIKTIEKASEIVDNIRGVEFTSKCEGDDPKVVYLGFIAEEVAKAEPRLVTYDVDGKLESVQYDRFVALLIEDNKAMHRRIETLEKRLEKLEGRLG